jgi:hypothetical protein
MRVRPLEQTWLRLTATALTCASLTLSGCILVTGIPPPSMTVDTSAARSSEALYFTALNVQTSNAASAARAMKDLMEIPHTANEDWREEVSHQIDVLNRAADSIYSLRPPPTQVEFHGMCSKAMDRYAVAVDRLSTCVLDRDRDGTSKACADIELATDHVLQAAGMLNSYPNASQVRTHLGLLAAWSRGMVRYATGRPS